MNTKPTKTTPHGATTPVVILGASGYVGGELLRLVAQHPSLQLAAAVSQSKAGEPIESTFPHLRSCFEGLAFTSYDEALPTLEQNPTLAGFSATPHAETASLVEAWFRRAEEHGTQLHWVDLSADFRLPLAEFEKVYGVPHGAPELAEKFHCGVPELSPVEAGNAICHPGCFTTAVTLACAPLVAHDLAEPSYHVAAVTGSTGSGRNPTATTHHPARNANYTAYKPLSHRHEPEMRSILGALTSEAPDVWFVPHSGPFARGIHATVHATLKQEVNAADLAQEYAGFYAGSPFVSVATTPPSLTSVVGTNRCEIAVAVRGRHVTVMSVIDNLVKGAAGGAVQWMNRSLGVEEVQGLESGGLGWL